MITSGEMRSKVDQIWEAFWSNGISNPISVIEQISYLLFLKRLDELELADQIIGIVRSFNETVEAKFGVA